MIWALTTPRRRQHQEPPTPTPRHPHGPKGRPSPPPHRPPSSRPCIPPSRVVAPASANLHPCSQVHHVTYESEEVERFKSEGGSSTTTWRTSSTAVSGCQLDVAAGTHQAPPLPSRLGSAHSHNPRRTCVEAGSGGACVSHLSSHTLEISEIVYYICKSKPL
jgi:hypothetical protein